MFRQRTYYFDGNDNSSTRSYGVTRGKYSQQHAGYVAPSTEYITSLADRSMTEKKVTNPYGTNARQQQAPPTADQRTKIKAIGAFTTIYRITREANIIEEEIAYLEAVERGDLEEVETILNDHRDSIVDEEDGDSIADGIVVIENGTKTNHSPKPEKTKTSLSSKVALSTNAVDKIAKEETKADVEMVELRASASKLHPNSGTPQLRRKSQLQNSNSAAKLRRMSTPIGSMWSKAVHLNNTAPLPVTLAKQNSFGHRYKKKNLDVETNERKSKFNKNCKDQWGRSALFIAMIHQNLDMLELLLGHKVKSEECLYHAIDFGYYDIVELFMNYDKHVNQMITKRDSFYPPGLTPFQLAAHKNDYVMLKILHCHGFDITKECKQRAFSKKNDLFSTSSVLDRAWDSSNHQLLYYRAIASPAYMIMTFVEDLEENSGDCDFLDRVFTLYNDLKKKVADEPAVRSLYIPLADQVEDFACDLLSEVRCSSDLASLLRFDPPGQELPLTSPRDHFAPVQRAIEVRMKRFVAHENSQLAISTLRQGAIFEREHGLRTFILRTLLALIFPLLCLGFNVFPNSKIGRLLRNPMVNMSCHIMSEVAFLAIMVIRLVLLTMVYECDCLGSSLYPIDYVVLAWVVARIVNQLKRFREVKLLSMIKNIWVLNDLATSGLFIFVIALKIYDLSAYKHLGINQCPATVNVTAFAQRTGIDENVFVEQCTRTKWTYSQSWPITISEASLAVIYLLIHVRAMELLYTDRTFGPLQLSLDKMFLDTIRFLFVFFVMFLAFAFAMTQLYWAWGRPKALQLKTELNLCEQDTNYSKVDCYPVYSYIYQSLLEQYWTLYGYGWGEEPPAATRIPNPHFNRTKAYEGFTEIGGQMVSMLFHVYSVVVMLNMLVAMMSHSFDRVRNNAELEWKFHRSVMWMKYIRKGIYPRPPPMNLIPSTRDARSFLRYVGSKLPQRFRARYAPDKQPLRERTQKENLAHRQALKHITNRYLRRYLLPDFRHDEIDQPVARNSRRPSFALDDGLKPAARSSEV